MITILSNGSKFFGQEPDSIADLIAVLLREPLDPRFEDYGGVIKMDGMRPGSLRIHGNFLRLSHVFDIRADAEEEVDDLIQAVKANLASEAYQQARAVQTRYRRKRRKGGSLP